MASTGKCEYCGATILSSDHNCPQCGAPNPNYIEEMKRTVFMPKTIEELKEYCSERGMPLLRMRFFIGEDYKEPKAFGIYQDGNEFVVYKNKANGTRAIRYQGEDEAYAVNELFQKLLEECHNRGIYPDGKPVEPDEAAVKRNKRAKGIRKVLIGLWCSMIAVAAAASIYSSRIHAKDGYYRVNDTYYYRYGSDWYVDSGSDWYELDQQPVESYEDYYIGEDYESDWSTSDFKSSETWHEIEESHSSDSSDYDSWDSSDTDWDSDW